MLEQLKDAVETKGWMRLWVVIGVVLMVLSFFGGSEAGFIIGILVTGLSWPLRWVVRGFDD